MWNTRKVSLSKLRHFLRMTLRANQACFPMALLKLHDKFLKTCHRNCPQLVFWVSPVKRSILQILWYGHVLFPNCCCFFFFHNRTSAYGRKLEIHCKFLQRFSLSLKSIGFLISSQLWVCNLLINLQSLRSCSRTKDSKLL